MYSKESYKLLYSRHAGITFRFVNVTQNDKFATLIENLSSIFVHATLGFSLILQQNTESKNFNGNFEHFIIPC